MKKIISVMLALTLVLGSFVSVFAGESWNYGQKVNYTPGHNEYSYSMDPWFKNGVAEELGIVAYEDLKANAYRGEAFTLIERMIQASLERKNQNLLTSRSTYLPFNDKNLLTQKAQEEAAILYERGILSGDIKGYMGFEKFVKRGEMATIIRNYDIAFFQLPKFRESKTFLDTEKHWAKPYVSYAYSIGMVNGMGFNSKGQELFGVEYNLSKQELIQIAYNLISGNNTGTYGINYQDLCVAIEETFKCTTNLHNSNSSNYVTSIDSNIDRVNLDAGKEKTVTFKLKPSDTNVNDVKFEMLDERIAFISKIVTSTRNNSIDVTVKGLKKGSTELLATSKGNKNVKEYVDINVDSNQNERVEILTENFSLNVNDYKRLSWEVTPSSASQDVYFTSSDRNVATVDSYGKVIAVGNGSAVITIETKNGYTDSVKVTVQRGGSSSEITEIVISQKTIDLAIGESKVLDVKVYPNNSLDNVTFTSSDKNVATVSSSGKVKAISEGSAYVYAKADNGIFATVSVYVSNSGGTVPSPSDKNVVMNVKGYGDSFTGMSYYNATTTEEFTIVVENTKSSISDRDISLTGNLSLKSGPVSEGNNKYSFVVKASNETGNGNISVLGTNMEIRIY